jgi:23S rRNA (cytidine1920-2'-O)/16S rRNA (cytidine1409-2'-O)-methyltransferase
MSRIRLDVLLAERGLAESRSLAQRLIMAGQVRVNGQVEIKPSSMIPEEALLVVDHGPRFVSRGGEKLQAALEAFPIKVEGRTCCDVGASTGGFTDCLLQHGARRVYAIDVGYGELHWKLRNDERVKLMERTNARYVTALPEQISLVTVDASFISIKTLLPAIRQWFIGNDGEIVALIKPQFEAGRKESARGAGVIRDREVHRQILADILNYCQNNGFYIGGLIRSPIVGPKGNIEFLVWLNISGGLIENETLVDLVEKVMLPENLNQ